MPVGGWVIDGLVAGTVLPPVFAGWYGEAVVFRSCGLLAAAGLAGGVSPVGAGCCRPLDGNPAWTLTERPRPLCQSEGAVVRRLGLRLVQSGLPNMPAAQRQSGTPVRRRRVACPEGRIQRFAAGVCQCGWRCPVRADDAVRWCGLVSLMGVRCGCSRWYSAADAGCGACGGFAGFGAVEFAEAVVVRGWCWRLADCVRLMRPLGGVDGGGRAAQFGGCFGVAVGFQDGEGRVDAQTVAGHQAGLVFGGWRVRWLLCRPAEAA